MEIEQAENGYAVKVWKDSEEKKEDYGYVEPELHVAKTVDEISKILTATFKEGK